MKRFICFLHRVKAYRGAMRRMTSLCFSQNDKSSKVFKKELKHWTDFGFWKLMNRISYWQTFIGHCQSLFCMRKQTKWCLEYTQKSVPPLIIFSDFQLFHCSFLVYCLIILWKICCTNQTEVFINSLKTAFFST